MAAIAPLDLLDLDALLTDEEREIRAVVRRVVDDQVRPHVADWYERRPGAGPRAGPRVRQARPARHAPDRVRLRRRLRGRVRRWPAWSWRPATPGVRSPGQRAGLAGHVRDLAVRLRGAEAALAARHGGRRADRLLRADRARPRLRPGVDGHPGPPRRRRLGAARRQDVDHQRAGGRRGGDLGPDRRGGARVRRADGHAGRHGPRDPAQAVAAGLLHRRDRARRRPAARPTPGCPRRAG